MCVAAFALHRGLFSKNQFIIRHVCFLSRNLSHIVTNLGIRTFWTLDHFAKLCHRTTNLKFEIIIKLKFWIISWEHYITGGLIPFTCSSQLQNPTTTEKGGGIYLTARLSAKLLLINFHETLQKTLTFLFRFKNNYKCFSSVSKTIFSVSLSLQTAFAYP